jgi:hypothetical protein
MKPTLIIILISTLLLSSCCKKITTQTAKENVNMSKQSKPFPPTIIYKTKSDYYNNVPVNLNEDKTMIYSFPDVKDVFYKGELAYPTKLDSNYLLDNRGISKNVAFLKYTYEEYSKLDKTPDVNELFKSILDVDPLDELYKCDCSRDAEEINRIILSNIRKHCIKIK